MDADPRLREQLKGRLTGEPPLLAINARSTLSERSEQRGFVNLVRETFGMW
nr:hypothetical protein CDS [Bradyrhizobium sp.]